jgi:hypothetical protein
MVLLGYKILLPKTIYIFLENLWSVMDLNMLFLYNISYIFEGFVILFSGIFNYKNTQKENKMQML